MIPFPGLTKSLSPRWRKSSLLLRPNPQLELLTSLALRRHLGCGSCLFLEKDRFGIAGLSAGTVFDLFSDPRYGALLSPENTKIKYHFTPLHALKPASNLWKANVNTNSLFSLQFIVQYYCSSLKKNKKKKLSFPTKPCYRKLFWIQDPANKPVVTSIAPMIHSEAF